MNVNEGKWFHIKEREGKEMYAGMNLTDREVKDMAEAKEATVLEAVPSNTVVLDKDTGKKMILLNVTSTVINDYYIAVQKNGDVRCGSVNKIKVLLTDEQKKLLE